MNKLYAIGFICMMIVLTQSPSVAAQLNGDWLPVVDRIVAAAQRGEPAPVVAASLQITPQQAYQLQFQSVARRLAGRKPEGFKAGLTSKKAQQKFAVDGPVAGVFIPGSALATERGKLEVDSQHFNQLMLEAELGFRFKQVISEKVDSVATLRQLVAAVVPAIELPDLGFSGMSAFNGEDIIANNVLAKRFYRGAAMKTSSVDINTISVTVRRDGKLLLTGAASDAMGDQWQALLWLVNHTVEQGYSIEPEQLLITGAIGRMLPGAPGHYQLDYGPLGTLELTII